MVSAVKSGPRYDGRRVTREQYLDLPDDGDLTVKSERYLATGVKEYWVADPEAKLLEIRVNRDNRSWDIRAHENLRSDLLHGLVIDTAWLFKDLRSTDS